jgi:predicted membrane-bound spermidine synthase
MSDTLTSDAVAIRPGVDTRLIPEAAIATTSVPRSRLLEPLVFVGGLSSIGIELSASRLVAPYFGSSTFIWANLIGLTLTYLAIGYYLGGRLADHRPDPRLLYLCTAVAAVTGGLIPIVARPILRISLDAFDEVAVGAFYGSLAGTILLLAIPITLLGFVTPFAIRLSIGDLRAAGKTSGRIYALSTVGSILGSFLPVLLFIPLFGTRASFFILSGALLLISIAGLWEAKSIRSMAVVTLLGLVMAATNVVAADSIKPPYRGELIYEAESEYNYIQVLKDGDDYLLALNEGQAVHSIYNPNELLTGGPWDYFTVAPLFNESPVTFPPKNALMIGLAGGTAARQMVAAYPEIRVDGVEIDQVVADVGRKYFGMNDPRINVIIEDGRYYLRTTGSTYDLIGVDAYKQPYIPFQLTTREFFTEVKSKLNDCGVAMVNVGRTETDFRLVDVIASTMRDVFPNVYAIDVERYTNTMVIGTTCPSSIAAFQTNAAALPGDNIAKTVADSSVAFGNMRVVEPGGRVFTDDHAPVELVVDEMIVDAAREGENK